GNGNATSRRQTGSNGSGTSVQRSVTLHERFGRNCSVTEKPITLHSRDRAGRLVRTFKRTSTASTGPQGRASHALQHLALFCNLGFTFSLRSGGSILQNDPDCPEIGKRGSSTRLHFFCIRRFLSDSVAAGFWLPASSGTFSGRLF